jgi:hypothetical protein
VGMGVGAVLVLPDRSERSGLPAVSALAVLGVVGVPSGGGTGRCGSVIVGVVSWG